MNRFTRKERICPFRGPHVLMGTARPIREAVAPQPMLAFPHLSSWITAAAGGGTIRHLLRVASRHTGIPVVVVAAIGIVISYRIVRKMARLVFEVTVAAAVLFAVSKLGWITW
jgi:hypothetical protein